MLCTCLGVRIGEPANSVDLRRQERSARIVPQKRTRPHGRWSANIWSGAAYFASTRHLFTKDAPRRTGSSHCARKGNRHDVMSQISAGWVEGERRVSRCGVGVSYGRFLSATRASVARFRSFEDVARHVVEVAQDAWGVGEASTPVFGVAQPSEGSRSQNAPHVSGLWTMSASDYS